MTYSPPGSNKSQVRTITSAANILATDEYVYANASAGSFVATLPSAAAAGLGKVIRIKKSDTDPTKYVQLLPGGSDTVEGATIFVTTPNYVVTLMSDGVSAWTRWQGYTPGSTFKIYSAGPTPVSVSNTVASTSLVPAGTGISSLTRNGVFFTLGRSISIDLGGILSVPAGSSLTFTIKANGVTIATMASSAGIFAGAYTNQGWTGTITLQCIAVGVSGKLVANGQIQLYSNGNVYSVASIVSGTGATVDLSATSVVIDVQAQWDSASTSRSITCNTFQALASS